MADFSLRDLVNRMIPGHTQVSALPYQKYAQEMQAQGLQPLPLAEWQQQQMMAARRPPVQPVPVAPPVAPAGPVNPNNPAGIEF